MSSPRWRDPRSAGPARIRHVPPGRDAPGPSGDSPIQARAQRTDLGCAGDGRARHERRWSVPTRRLPSDPDDDRRRCSCPDVRLGSGCAQSDVRADRTTARVRPPAPGARGRELADRLRGWTRPWQMRGTAEGRYAASASGPLAPTLSSTASAATRASRRPFTYARQCSAHIVPRPPVRLGCVGAR